MGRSRARRASSTASAASRRTTLTGNVSLRPGEPRAHGARCAPRRSRGIARRHPAARGRRRPRRATCSSSAGAAPTARSARRVAAARARRASQVAQRPPALPEPAAARPRRQSCSASSTCWCPSSTWASSRMLLRAHVPGRRRRAQQDPGQAVQGPRDRRQQIERARSASAGQDRHQRIRRRKQRCRDAVKLTRKDFESDQDVRWCPGCGDYAILAPGAEACMPELGIPRENIVFVSRHRLLEPLPVLHEHLRVPHDPRPRAGDRDRPQGRAARARRCGWSPATATACRSAATTCIHALRRNVDLKILLFNNRIYGLTKGQYSPTSRARQEDQVARRSGSIDHPFNPLALALGAGATFVARTVDVDAKHLQRGPASAPPRTRAPRSSRSTRTATSSTTARSTLHDREGRQGRRAARCSSTASRWSSARTKDKGIRLNAQARARGRRPRRGRRHRARTSSSTTRRTRPSAGCSRTSSRRTSRPRSASSAPSRSRPTTR